MNKVIYAIKPSGAYYEGPGPVADGSKLVPQRPSRHHIWRGSAWELDNAAYEAALIAEYRSAIQRMLDDVAKSMGYSHVLSAASYASLPQGAPFQAESIAIALWRAACWVKAYEILHAVKTKARSLPSIPEVLNEMPKFRPPHPPPLGVPIGVGEVKDNPVYQPRPQIVENPFPQPNLPGLIISELD